jgi:cytochrome b6-f complex iron-sulfur subunit
MERKEFLSLIGLGSASAFAAVCMGGCAKSAGANSSSVTPAPTNVNITLDLTQTANAALTTSGGYIYTGGIIVAKTMAGNYIAVSQSCTHEGATIRYEGANQRFYCASHGATFSNTGAVTGGPANTSLKQYSTSLNGNILTVSS